MRAAEFRDGTEQAIANGPSIVRYFPGQALAAVYRRIANREGEAHCLHRIASLPKVEGKITQDEHTERIFTNKRYE